MGRRKVEVNMKHATYEEIQELYRDCNDLRVKLRYMAILRFMEDNTSLRVAELMQTSDSTVREWLRRYNQWGPPGLLPEKQPGAECKLSEEQQKEVYEIMQKSPRDAGFNKSNWTMPLLKKWISKEYGINYGRSSMYDLAHRLGMTIQRPKKRCKNGDPVKQNMFMQELRKEIQNADDDTVFLYEDEAILTSEPTTTGKWAPIGCQPIIPTDSKGTRQRRVIFGACNPKNGDVIYSTRDSGNSENFEDFLK